MRRTHGMRHVPWQARWNCCSIAAMTFDAADAGVASRIASPSEGASPSSPRSPWCVAQSPSFKSLLSYAENPPQELAAEQSLNDVTSSWIGEAVRVERGRRYFSGVRRSDGFRSVQFHVGNDVMVLAPNGGLPYLANIQALFEQADAGLPPSKAGAEGGRAGERSNENKLAQLRWYYRPCDCQGHEAKSRFQNHAKTTRSKEVFVSDWTDENPVDSFLKNCYVLPRDVYSEFAAELYDDVFFCKERYCPVKRRFSSCEDLIRRRNHKHSVCVLSERKLASYRKPRLGSDYQCLVPAFGRAQSPSSERGDKLVFDRARAFKGAAARSAAVEKLLDMFRINESSSAGVSEEIALMALYRTNGDVRKAELQLKSLKDSKHAGLDADGAAALQRQSDAMEREKKEHEHDLIQEQMDQVSVRLEMGDSSEELAAARGGAQRGSRVKGCSGELRGKDLCRGVGTPHMELVHLDCDKPFPDGECSNKGVFFDIVNKTRAQVLVMGFAAGTLDEAADVCVWACDKGKSEGSEQKRAHWRQVWRGIVQPKTKTDMRFAKPLLVGAGEERGILMHTASNRVCYSRKLQSAEDGVLLLRPWFATSSNVPFLAHQQDSFKYIFAGSISYTTCAEDARALTSSEATAAVTCSRLEVGEGASLQGQSRTGACHDVGSPRLLVPQQYTREPMLRTHVPANRVDPAQTGQLATAPTRVAPLVSDCVPSLAHQPMKSLLHPHLPLKLAGRSKNLPRTAKPVLWQSRTARSLGSLSVFRADEPASSGSDDCPLLAEAASHAGKMDSGCRVLESASGCGEVRTVKSGGHSTGEKTNSKAPNEDESRKKGMMLPAESTGCGGRTASTRTSGKRGREQGEADAIAPRAAKSACNGKLEGKAEDKGEVQAGTHTGSPLRNMPKGDASKLAEEHTRTQRKNVGAFARKL